MPPAHARSCRFGAAAAAAACALLLAACGAGGGAAPTEPPPPDRLTVTLSSERGVSFAVTLDCAVADRAACSEILDAIAQERDAATCAPITPTGERIAVRGTIGGREVGTALERRTDCEARLFDRVREALGP